MRCYTFLRHDNIFLPADRVNARYVFSRDLFDSVLYLNIALTATIPNSLTEHLQTDFARLHFRGIFRNDSGIV